MIMKTHFSFSFDLCEAVLLCQPVLYHFSVCTDPSLDGESLPLRLVPEERISFGINPAISSLTTVVQIREDYNEVDCRLIAKEVR